MRPIVNFFLPKSCDSLTAVPQMFCSSFFFSEGKFPGSLSFKIDPLIQSSAGFVHAPW